MEVHQEKSRYQPIKIILRTRAEAEAFFNLIDRLDRSNAWKASDAERQLIIDLSNAYSNADIVF